MRLRQPADFQKKVQVNATPAPFSSISDLLRPRPSSKVSSQPMLNSLLLKLGKKLGIQTFDKG